MNFTSYSTLKHAKKFSSNLLSTVFLIVLSITGTFRHHFRTRNNIIDLFLKQKYCDKVVMQKQFRNNVNNNTVGINRHWNVYVCAYERETVWDWKGTQWVKEELGERIEITTQAHGDHHKSQCHLQGCSVQLHTQREKKITFKTRNRTNILDNHRHYKKKKKKSVQRPTCFHINYAGNRLIDASVSMNSKERERGRENPSGWRCSLHSPTSSV